MALVRSNARHVAFRRRKHRGFAARVEVAQASAILPYPLNIQQAGFDALPIVGLLVPDRHGDRLSRCGAACALWGEYFHRGSGGACHAARIGADDGGDHRRRALRFGLCRTNRHHESDRGNRCAAHHGRVAVGVAGAAETDCVDDRDAFAHRVCGFHRGARRHAGGEHAARWGSLTPF